MRYLLSASEMKKVDQNTVEKIGIPSLVLMERAALATFQALQTEGKVKKGEHAFIIAGCGNNGGDGLALARILCEAGMSVEIKIVGNLEKATDSWKKQKEILANYPVSICNEPSLDTYTVIVDSLFGVGLSREVKGEFALAIDMANQLKGFKVALDLPSGIDSDRGQLMGVAFYADLTVTFGFEKRGLYLYPGANYAGKVLLADIGISERAFLGEKPEMFCLDGEIQELLPPRRKDGNKGTFGKALILAGTDRMAGAALLCTKSCYAIGAGMVRLLTHPDNRLLLQESIPEAMFGTMGEAEHFLDWCDVICIGPGMGTDEGARSAFYKVLTDSDKPIVVDADGLNLLSVDRELAELVKKQGQSGRSIILTPHLGELKKLYQGIMMGNATNAVISMKEIKQTSWIWAQKLAKELNAVVVSKDARTCICTKDREICLNLTGNSGMATAGSGDVLAGIVTGMLCQGLPAFEAACRAVRIHGLAGDRASLEFGEYGMMAGDMIAMLRKA